MPKSKYNIANLACHDYLQQMAQGFAKPCLTHAQLQGMGKKDREKYLAVAALLEEIRNKPNFSNQKNYQKVYTKLHSLAEQLPRDVLMPNADYPPLLKSFHAQFFIQLFENNNQAPEPIYQAVIAPERENTQLTDHDRIFENLHDKTTYTKPSLFNISHPESMLNRIFSGVFGIDYHPLKKNNIPYISFDHGTRRNLRFGAQINGLNNTNTAFEQFLAAKNYQQRIQTPDETKDYHHVYINLQKQQIPTEGGLERYIEGMRSKSLHGLEDKDLGIAVVTLPADGKFFFGGFHHASGRAKSDARPDTLNNMLNGVIDGITQNQHDFYLSDAVRNKVFGGTLEEQQAVIRRLFEQSVKDTLGTERDINSEVSVEERQAILFHFVKFNLTEHILQTLNPDTYNISCKDNIDRGGVHNLWYETNLKLQKGEEVTLDWFNKHFHASALLVKERPVNNHRHVIWNAFFQAYKHNPEKFDNMPWMGDWLKQNIPIDKKTKQLLEKSESKLSKTEKKQCANFLEFKSTVSQVIAQQQTLFNQRLDALAALEPEAPHIRTRGPMQTKDLLASYQTICQRHFEQAAVSVKQTMKSEAQQQYVISDQAAQKSFPDIIVTSTQDRMEPKESQQDFRLHVTQENEDQIKKGLLAMADIAILYSKQHGLKECEVRAGNQEQYAILLCVELAKNGIKPVLNPQEFNAEQQARIMQESQRIVEAIPKQSNVKPHTTFQGSLFNLQTAPPQGPSYEPSRQANASETLQQDQSKSRKRSNSI